jgi:hypothetical protein
MASAARYAIVLLALVTACQDDPNTWPARPAVYPAFRIVESTVWAGSPITLRMHGPGEHPASGTLVLEYNLRVPLTPLGDSAMTGIIPQGAIGGTQDARLELGAFDTLLGPIYVAGIVAQSAQSINLAQGHIYGAPFLPGSGTFLVGVQDGATAISHIGDWPTLLGVAAHHLTAPGPTPDPDVWLLRSTPNGPLERWRLDNTPVMLGTLPFVGNGPWQTVADLGNNRLLAIDGDGGQILRRAAAGEVGVDPPYLTERSFQVTGLNRVVISPRGDRAAITASTGASGIPVFRVPDGDVAYPLDADKAATSVDFSPDGALLAVAVGPDHLNAVSIQIRDATTGVIQRQLHGDRRVYRGLAFDPHRPLLYAIAVANKNAGSLPVFELEVWSTTNWQLLTRLDGRCILGCTSEVLIVVGPRNDLYTIETSVGTSEELMVTHRYLVPPVE